mmetsp:Transcript_26314/g.30107  ORF Transcript_26314/g.30107 Transcript_26314/m.30107 type:complete len:187 (+) Transcript_26314:254-814(+)
MPAVPKYNPTPSTTRPHVVNMEEKGLESFLRKMDERTGDILLFDISESSLDLDNLGIDIEPSESSSSEDSSETSQQGVRFSKRIVSEIWERPITALEEKQDLYYTAEEIWEFRKEYKAFMKSRLAAKKNGLEESNEPNNTSFFSRIWNNATQAASSFVQTEESQSSQRQEERRTEIDTVIDTLYLF